MEGFKKTRHSLAETRKRTINSDSRRELINSFVGKITDQVATNGNGIHTTDDNEHGGDQNREHNDEHNNDGNFSHHGSDEEDNESINGHGSAAGFLNLPPGAFVVNVQDIIAATTRAVMEALRLGNQAGGNEANREQREPVNLGQNNLSDTMNETPRYSDIEELIPLFGENVDDDIEKWLRRVDEVRVAYNVPENIIKLQASRR